VPSAADGLRRAEIIAACYESAAVGSEVLILPGVASGP
jgi:hypothetical protein